VTRLETLVPPLVWMVLGILIVAGVSATLDEQWLDGGAARVAALAFIVIGLGFLGSAVFGFGKAKTTVDPHSIARASTLVTGGVYRLTRNPMYLGMFCVVLAAGLGRGGFIALVLGAASFVLVMTRLQILPEERMLTEIFGAEYTDFMASVRRWI
jgi:protein-S-isoprenylcysteine O-methyltransferase Ste14